MKIINIINTKKGFSLFEIIIAMTLIAIIMYAALDWIITSTRANDRVREEQQLNEQARAALAVIVGDMRKTASETQIEVYDDNSPTNNLLSFSNSASVDTGRKLKVDDYWYKLGSANEVINGHDTAINVLYRYPISLDATFDSIPDKSQYVLARNLYVDAASSKYGFQIILNQDISGDNLVSYTIILNFKKWFEKQEYINANIDATIQKSSETR